jgi:hypothetical protein
MPTTIPGSIGPDGGLRPAVVRWLEVGFRFLSTDGMVPVDSLGCPCHRCFHLHKVLTMTTNKKAKPAALSGTMDAPEAATLQATAARAQAELIELLARLVLVEIEAEAAVAAATRECGADERRTRRPGI